MASFARFVLTASLLIAPAAHAAARPTAKLVRCGAEECLLVRGARSAADATITINDRVVPASGGRNWKARISLANVKSLASPFARTLSVAVVDSAGRVEQREPVRLPVGLLGYNTELAALVVRAR
ncbi:hypothetical protein [Sphingomonas azotifigens]|uniref:hypothetical protein n=1 Tax=Sphingomonas azotifigens TaxID=330920 RepID=UPI0009FC3D55|nr:hypothetical protein [Sphingomonas azotifigens]